jgi:hypothetical protein
MTNMNSCTSIPMTIEDIRSKCVAGLTALEKREEKFFEAIATHALANLTIRRKWWQKPRPLTPEEALKEAENIVYDWDLCNTIEQVRERDEIAEHRNTMSRLLNTCSHVADGSNIWVSLEVTALFDKYQ